MPWLTDIKVEAKKVLREDPNYASASDAQLNTYIDNNLSLYLDDINDSLTFDQTTLGTDAQLTETLNEAENSLAEVRPYTVMFQWAFIGLIIFIVLVAGGIVGLNLSVRKATRALGIVLLVYGVIEFIPMLILKPIANNYLNEGMPTDTPVYLQNWYQQIASDSMSPLWWFSLCCLIAGVALLIVSFVYRPAEKASTAPPTTTEQIQS